MEQFSLDNNNIFHHQTLDKMASFARRSNLGCLGVLGIEYSHDVLIDFLSKPAMVLGKQLVPKEKADKDA